MLEVDHSKYNLAPSLLSHLFLGIVGRLRAITFNISQPYYKECLSIYKAPIHHLYTRKLKRAAPLIQQITMTVAATQLCFLLLFARSACCLHSSMTSGGIIFRTSQMPIGTRIRSSKYPRMGIKSGIRSIGDKA